MIIERISNYCLASLGLVLAGIFASCLSLGAYPMSAAFTDTIGIMIAVAGCDCVWQIRKMIYN